jgi:hypothetical protein
MRISSLVVPAFVMLIAMASPAYAQAPACTQPAAQVFEDLTAYYARPVEQRIHYKVSYVLDSRSRGSATALTLTTHEQQRALHTDSSGRLSDPPTEEELASGGTVNCVDGGTIIVRTVLEPVFDLAHPIAVADATAAMAEVDSALSAQRGMRDYAQLGMPMPRARGLRFRVSAAATGEAVWQDGHRVSLARQGDDLVFRPEQAEGAITIEFSEPPSAASFLVLAGQG